MAPSVFTQRGSRRCLVDRPVCQALAFSPQPELELLGNRTNPCVTSLVSLQDLSWQRVPGMVGGGRHHVSALPE